jgi:twitching motility protein PilT
MQTGGKFGMQTMDAALVELVRRNVISREEAKKRARDPEELDRLAGSGGMAGMNAGGSSSGGRGKYSAIRR